jgi:predicted ATP-grasp superfamily ATP-dependent carboligase
VLQRVLSLIDDEVIDVVIAAGLPGNEFICRHRAMLEPVVIAPYNDYATFDRLSNKARVVELAEALDIPRPRTVELTSLSDIERRVENLGYPIVFKSAADQGTVEYARNLHQLTRIMHAFWMKNENLIRKGIFPIAQQYIQGRGHGYYALADRGEILASFMHRRLHEVPSTGGPSSMASSYRDPELERLGKKILTAACWTGVAMVEFKKNESDGRYYLLEVNPKFWGSLDLSIAAGVDFPRLLLELLVNGRRPCTTLDYRDDCVFRWLALDLAHAVETRTVSAYLKAFADRRIRDDFVFSDPLPFLLVFLSGIRRYARRIT